MSESLGTVGNVWSLIQPKRKQLDKEIVNYAFFLLKLKVKPCANNLGSRLNNIYASVMSLRLVIEKVGCNA